MLSELPGQSWGVSGLLEVDLNVNQLKKNELLSKNLFGKVV